MHGTVCIQVFLDVSTKYHLCVNVPIRGSNAYSEDTLRKAIQLQQTMTADFGGTEFLKPLEHMYSQQIQAGYSRQVDQFQAVDSMPRIRRYCIALIYSPVFKHL